MALLLRVALLCWTADITRSLTITTSEQRFEKAKGETVHLPCKFTIDPEDQAPLDIEWNISPADHQKADQEIILYSGGKIYDNYSNLKGRVYFTSTDPKLGDASINVTNLQLSDMGTYQCKVKKLPGVANKKMELSVLVKPSETRCYVDGSSEIGSDFKLKCESMEGSLPLYYEWQKLSNTEKFPFISTATDLKSPIISIRNATPDYSGTYSCTVKNRVGVDLCLLRLNVVPPSNVAGTIAGAVIGTLCALLLLGLLIFCCCKKRKEEKYEKEVHHDIREDVPPPKSRTSTARSYIGSNHSSLGSMSPSNIEGYSKAQYNQVPSEDFDRIPQNQSFPPTKVAASNLSRMGAIPVMIPAQSKDGSIV